MKPIATTLALACLAVAVSAGEDQTPEPPKPGWHRVRVELSDGRALTGRARVPGDTLLLYDPAAERRVPLRLGDVRQLTNAVEKQGLREKWFFRESGRDDKVYTGEHYPVRHYRTRVRFADGSRLTGYLVPRTLHLRTDDGRRRLILRRKHEGEVGQKLSDLVFVRTVTLLDGGGVQGEIRGALKAPEEETLKRVVAVNRDTLFSTEAALAGAEGRFRAAGCPPGTYDVAAVTDRAVYLHFSVESAEDGGRLDARAVAGLQAWVDELRDFHHSQRVLYAAGNDRRTFALVWKERRSGTTLSGLKRLHRYEIWALHRPREQWQIQERIFLGRRLGDREDLPRLKVVVLPELGGHRIGEDSPRAELRTTLRDTAEKPIPAPAESEPEKSKGQED
ncbi:MAG: hypothetical protein ACOC7T_02340 [Planctomycetota bacterium]